MNGLHLFYTTHDGGMPIEWPNIYRPALRVIDGFTLGKPYVEFPMTNGMEHIHSFIWYDEDMNQIHRWDSINGWTDGGPE